jgi:hypothetical protein
MAVRTCAMRALSMCVLALAMAAGAPPLAGGIKPGHGFGDRNHTHQHRRGSRR